MDDIGEIFGFIIQLIAAGFALIFFWGILQPILEPLFDPVLGLFRKSKRQVVKELNREALEKSREAGFDVSVAGNAQSDNHEDIETWTKRLRTLWSGKGPEIMFGYDKASGADSGRRRRVAVRALVAHPQRGMYLRGQTPQSKNESYFKISRINTSIALDDRVIPVNDFFGMLREGRFASRDEAKPPDATNKGAAKPKRESTPEPEKPELPRFDTRAARAQAVLDLALDASGWRKQGVLSLSGYHVGKSYGRPENIRHKILNTIVLYDDLSDVPDRAYAAEWGSAASRRRYKKVHDSIQTFLNTARRRDGKQDFTEAIGDWESDLAYLERKLKNYL